MRPILSLFALIFVAACGIDGPPPAGEVEGSPSTGGFTPEDY